MLTYAKGVPSLGVLEDLGDGQRSSPESPGVSTANQPPLKSLPPEYPAPPPTIKEGGGARGCPTGRGGVSLLVGKYGRNGGIP